MVKKAMEAVTLAGALFLAAGTDSSLLCGIAGLVLLVSFRWEMKVWEGGV